MTDDQTPTVDDGPTISFEVRPKCSKCERLATVFDRDGTAYCARHATIFMYGRDKVQSAESRIQSPGDRARAPEGG